VALSISGAVALAVLIVIIASFPAVIWFFRIRRLMIRRIAGVARDLEETVKPRDQRYWYLGYLVGFRARYWVNRGSISTVSALYIIPPYHVFFYLPVIILGRRRELLDIAVKLRSRPLVRGVAHLVDSSSRHARVTFRKDVGDPRGLRRVEVDLGDARLEAYYSGDEAPLSLARDLAVRLQGLGARVLRVTVDPGGRILYSSLNPPRGGPVAPLIEAVLDAAERLARGA
jgi:hypothetical protein